jgi:hypothetical protein
MVRLLIRCAFFLFGLVLLVDTGLPMRVETLQVDRHSSRVDNDRRTASPNADTSYTLHLIGGHVASCSVGYGAYSRLADGDAITVHATRLLRNCVRLEREQEVIEAQTHWKWFTGAAGLVMLAVAVGWLRSDDDDDRSGISIRF